METTLYRVTQAGFIVLTIVFGWLLLKELKKALLKTGFTTEKQKRLYRGSLIFLTVWITFLSILSLRGFFADFSIFPPRMMIVIIVPLITIVIITFSKNLKAILAHVPPKVLLQLQVFRVFVEILLWMLFIQNLLPEQMTFEGKNFDILAGLTGPIFAYLCFAKKIGSKAVVILWNLAGLLLLANIVTIALLSLPTPFRVFMNEPANTIVAYFPIIWLPGFLVPLAYGLHFFSLRQLISTDVNFK